MPDSYTIASCILQWAVITQIPTSSHLLEMVSVIVVTAKKKKKIVTLTIIVTRIAVLHFSVEEARQKLIKA